MARAEITHANCGHCGAPLAISAGPILVCQYCGREHRVSLPQPAPAPQPYPYPQPHPRHATHHGSFPWRPLVAWAVILLAVSAFGAVRWFLSSPATPIGRAGLGKQPGTAPTVPAGGAPDAWHADAPVFLKGEGEVPNPVGVAGWPNLGYQLTALHGATGKVLWHAPAASGAHAYADGASAVLLVEPGNKLSSYDAQTGKQKWAITLAAGIYDVTFGPNCASVYLGNSNVLGLALDSGQPGPCTPSTKAVAPVVRDELRDYRAQSGDLTVIGSLRADPKPINPEPTRLAVEVRRGGKQLWQAAATSLEPVWTGNGFPRSMTLTPAGVFVFGRHAGDDLARWVLLDLASGRFVYEHTGTTKLKSMPHLASAGPMVFVSHDLRLEAYVAATGALRWFAGSAD